MFCNFKIRPDKGIESCHKLKSSEIPIPLQPDGVNLWFFKLRLFYLAELSLKYLRYTTLG